MISVYLNSTRAPLRGWLVPLASLAQGRMQLKHERVAERRGPWFGATSELIKPKAVYAELLLVALCCALCGVLVDDVTF